MSLSFDSSKLWNSYTMHTSAGSSFRQRGATIPTITDWQSISTLALNCNTTHASGAGTPVKSTGLVASEVITFTREIRFLGELFSGDPFIFEDEFPAFQTGFRWYKTPDVQWDFVWRGARAGSGRKAERFGTTPSKSGSGFSSMSLGKGKLAL